MTQDPRPTPDLQRFPDPAALTRAAAEHVVGLAARAIGDHGRFSIALSGGSTPRRLHELLAGPGFADRVDWPNVHVFFGDERCVPPDDAQSNYRMAHETLLAQVPIPPQNVYRMRGEAPPAEAAADYEVTLRDFFGGDPRFDLVLLGMGDNGHTASLFPNLTAVHEARRLVLAEYVAEVGMWRITLTPVAINAAADIAFLVTGADKAAMLPRVLEGPYDPAALPAQIVAPSNGLLHWFVDAAAAANLRQ